MRRLPCLTLAAALMVLTASCSEDDPDSSGDICGDTKSAAGGSTSSTTYSIINGTDQPEAVELTEAQIKSAGEVKIGGKGYYTTCSAALVAPKVVLTGGHCLDDPETTYIRFNSGVDYLNPDHTFEAAEWHMHPSYPGGGSGYKYDIGVVLLQEDATTQGLEPIPINATPQSLVGETIQAVGYGRTIPDVSGNTIRYWTSLPVVDESDIVYMTNTGDSTGICIGDSGGPMLWERPGKGVHVMGVATTGNAATCQGNIYFPRTDGYLDFLSTYITIEVDPCGAETPLGRCDGDTAVWCEDDAVQTQACADDGMECGLGQDGSYRCQDPGDVISQECARLGHAGECVDVDGSAHARWCEDGRIRDRDCTACDQTCGFTGDSLGYYCQ